MDARGIARLKERRIRYQLQQREADQEEEGMAPVPPMNAPAANRGQGNQDQQELLSRITHQLEDLSAHLVRGGRGPPPNQEQARGPRRQAQEYHCYDYGENGHAATTTAATGTTTYCTYPPLPLQENRAVNVISLDAKVKVEEEERGKSLPKDKGKAKVEEVDAMPIKRARQEEVAMSETGERRKSKENGESNSKKKLKRRRMINVKDFALGGGLSYHPWEALANDNAGKTGLGTGMLELQPHKGAKKGKAIHIDLKEGKHESLDLETSVVEFSSSDYSTSKEESTITDESNSSQANIMGVLLTNPTLLNVDKCHIAESQVTLLGHVASSRGIEADPDKVQALVGLPSPKSAKELVSFIQKLNVDKCHIAESQVTLLGHVASSRGIEADPDKVQALVGLPSPKSAKELVSFIQKVSWSEKNEQLFNEIKELLSSLPTIAPPRWEETFYVNPSVGSDSIGAVLMQKDGETSFMRSIYFVSRVMTPLEKDYTMIEQMVMALMFAVGRFRSYLLPKKFVILTMEDIFPLVLQHMDVLLARLQEMRYGPIDTLVQVL
ncbi:hypothetical protein L7F22_055036 [Adiantum nelumboides]|nr:hypothetical protein [Adiantum nelumboides]